MGSASARVTLAPARDRIVVAGLVQADISQTRRRVIAVSDYYVDDRDRNED
jgi:hypothetical protein